MVLLLLATDFNRLSLGLDLDLDLLNLLDILILPEFLGDGGLIVCQCIWVILAALLQVVELLAGFKLGLEVLGGLLCCGALTLLSNFHVHHPGQVLRREVLGRNMHPIPSLLGASDGGPPSRFVRCRHSGLDLKVNAFVKFNFDTTSF